MVVEQYNGFYWITFLSGFMVPVIGERQNLALNKTAYQSSTYYVYDLMGHASRAVDGNTNGSYLLGKSCSHTSKGYGDWWEVDLGTTYDVKEVIVYNRGDCCQERLGNYIVFGGVDCDPGPKCYTQCYHHQTAEDIQVLRPDNCTARYIKIVTQLDQLLVICEVQIFNELILDESTSEAVSTSVEGGTISTTSLDTAPTSTERGSTSLDTATTSTERGSTSLDTATTSTERGSTSLDRAQISTERGSTSLNTAPTATERGSTSLDTAQISTERGSTSLDTEIENITHSPTEETIATTNMEEPTDNGVTLSTDPTLSIGHPSTQKVTTSSPNNSTLHNCWIDNSIDTMLTNSDMINPPFSCALYCPLLPLRPEEIEIIKQFKVDINTNLTVAVGALSSTRRKKTSADDTRPSAVYCGYFGIIIIGISLGGFVLSDIYSVLSYFYQYLKR